MSVKAFRGIGRQWIEVGPDTPPRESLTYTSEDDDQGDELATRRGWRPGRPIALLTACEGGEK